MADAAHRLKKGGRPRKEKAERRESYISFRVNDEECAAIFARAKSIGKPVSDFARATALGSPVRQNRPSQHSPELVAQLRRIGNNLNQCLKEARIGNFPLQVADAAEEAIKEVSAVLRAQFHAPEHR
jgi:hypothetical protein